MFFAFCRTARVAGG